MGRPTLTNLASLATLSCLLWACAPAAEGEKTGIGGGKGDELGTLPVVDGRFGDWSPAALAAQDPLGDATGGFDLTRVYVQSSGARVVLRFDVNQLLTLQSGPSEQGELALTFTHGEQSLMLAVRQRAITHFAAGQDPAAVTAREANYVVAPTHAAEEFEVAIDLTRLGVSAGDQVTISIDGSDSLEQPIVHRLGDAKLALGATSAARPASTQFRLMNMNIWSGALLDPERAPAMARILKFANPDVILLQETKGSTAEVAQALSDALGGTWYVTDRTPRVASRYPLTEQDAGKETLAIVDHPEGPIALVSVHVTCCFHIGSKRDQQRIDDIRAMLDDLLLLHVEHPEMPIVVGGDFNFVGSYETVGMLESSLLAFNAPAYLQLDAPDIYTWYDANDKARFGAGRLDVVAHSSALLAVNGVVLNSLAVSEEKRGELLPSDSSISDHLPIIVDYAPAP